MIGCRFGTQIYITNESQTCGCEALGILRPSVSVARAFPESVTARDTLENLTKHAA